MPQCVEFISLKTEVVVGLNKLDEEICKVVGDEVHPRAYCRGWFDTIAFEAAMGRTWDEIRERIKDYGADGLLPVLDYLEANYSIRAWYER